MAPASPKKAVLKKTASKKTGSKKTAIKKMSPKKTTPNKVSSKKKTAPNKKTSPKKTAPKKPAPKKAALKKKIATKRAAKDPKRARLDASSDLANLLTTSAGVLDIFAASGSRPLPMEVVLDVVMRGELKLPHKMFKMYEFRFSI